MGEIDRAAHVPERWRAAAYGDRSIPLPGGGAMMPPAALGRILTRMALPASGSFRLIGEDSYAAALLSAMGLVAAGDDSPADVLLFTGAVRAIDEGRCGPLAPGARAGGALQERGVSRLFTATRTAAGWSIDRFGDAAVEPLAGDRPEPGFTF
jgi:protein-L-isoaspartate(D-aspartate) O-methyltransferase